MRYGIDNDSNTGYLYMIVIWDIYICNVNYIIIYPLVMTNIAMENPNHKWRFRSRGKSSISIRAIYTMAM